MKFHSPGFERRFLLTANPPGLRSAPRVHIQQGFLSSDRRREVCILQRSASCFMSVRDGRAEARGETEVELGRVQFENLWPLTEGARIAVTRYAISHAGSFYHIDVYEGPHASLSVASITFSTRAESKAFVKPQLLGTEVTDRDEYRNSYMAAHGIPVSLDGRSQSGALPFLFKKGELHIVLVTSSSGLRWIVPKGQLERRMSRQDVALMEAAEEAGVIGAVEPDHQSYCRLEDGRTMHLYPLRVFTLLKRWPEAGFRKRSVLPVRRALSEIEDRELADCIERLAARLSE